MSAGMAGEKPTAMMHELSVFTPMEAEPLHCPTCRARWRAGSSCRRCDTDLSTWLAILLSAYRLREQARLAFLSGNYASARRSALQAWQLQRTERGRQLLLLSQLAK